VLIEGGGELHFAVPDELLQKGSPKFSSLRPLLDASFLLETLRVVALLLDSLSSSRVLPINGVVWFTGDIR
jgi:hypothetical protein